MENNQQETSKIKLDFKDSKYATGKRKTSVAKVWLKKGTGKIYVNGKNFDNTDPKNRVFFQEIVYDACMNPDKYTKTSQEKKIY